MKNKVGAKLKKLRTEIGWTIREVEERLHIPAQNISTYETSKIKNIPTDNLVKFANLYKVDLNYFYLDELEYYKKSSTNKSKIKDIVNANYMMMKSLDIPESKIREITEQISDYLTRVCE